MNFEFIVCYGSMYVESMLPMWGCFAGSQGSKNVTWPSWTDFYVNQV